MVWDKALPAPASYYDTAELSNVTDPHLVFDLRVKLDAAGFYDEFEVNRVVDVELNPKAKQSDLMAALEPVVSRLLVRYKTAQEHLRTATAKNDAKAMQDAPNDIMVSVSIASDLAWNEVWNRRTT